MYSFKAGEVIGGIYAVSLDAHYTSLYEKYWINVSHKKEKGQQERMAKKMTA